jgi:hypothetical protein
MATLGEHRRSDQASRVERDPLTAGSIDTAFSDVAIFYAIVGERRFASRVGSRFSRSGLDVSVGGTWRGHQMPTLQTAAN